MRVLVQTRGLGFLVPSEFQELTNITQKVHVAWGGYESWRWKSIVGRNKMNQISAVSSPFIPEGMSSAGVLLKFYEAP